MSDPSPSPRLSWQAVLAIVVALVGSGMLCVELTDNASWAQGYLVVVTISAFLLIVDRRNAAFERMHRESGAREWARGPASQSDDQTAKRNIEWVLNPAVFYWVGAAVMAAVVAIALIVKVL